MIVGSLITVAYDTGGTIQVDAAGRSWKRPDGSLLLVADYLDLYGIISNRYGDTTPGVNFRLPDFRARFLRGWDPTGTLDVDVASRTIPGPGATSTEVGTVQAENFMPHTHPIPGFQYPPSTTNAPNGQLEPGPGAYRAGPSQPLSPISATTINPGAKSTFGPSTDLKPYHVVVDLLIRIK